jgi:lipase
VHEWGDPARPTIVCVHGVTGHGKRFARLARERLTRRFHVLAPDLRGHGHSSWEPPWTLEQHVADLLESVPVDARLWVGHSFGGRLLLELAASTPARLDRAVLLDPVIWVPPPIALHEAEALRADVSFATVDEAVDARLALGMEDAVPRELLAEDFRAHLQLESDGRLRFRYCRSAAIAAYGEMARTPPDTSLQRPIRIARAVQSRVCPPELVQAYRELAGDLLSVVELPGGHHPMWEAPRETADEIERFLA